MINIKELSEENLKQIIENIKDECEKKINALKRYEDELERLKQEVPLGVPLEDKTIAHHFGVYEFGFTSEESQHVFYERVKDYVESLQKLAKGEPIDIKVLFPLMKKGWVAMDKDGDWFWYECKPFKEINFWDSKEGMFEDMFFPINIKPADDWEASLMECGL